jgi:Pirin
MLDGIFQHQDSNGGSGLISDGDIQWMTAVYSSAESLTGDLEAYDDAGVLQVYDAQARYLPLTWQAPDPAAGPGRRAWVHRNRARRTGSMMRCGGSCR